MIIYSANFGDKDKLKDPLVDSSWSKDLKFVYFTDQEFKSPVWDIVVEQKTGDSTRIARWYKMHSHELFPKETTVWIDANLLIIKDPTELMDRCSHLFIQDHPFRFCLYEEAEYCIRKRKGEKKDIQKQMDFYKKQYYPEFFGLYTSRVLFRKPTEKTILLNQKWWEQIKQFSTRDQVSLPYVLWKNWIPFNTIDSEELKTYFYKRGGHKFRGTREI